MAQSDIVLMAVKPYNIEEVVKEHYDAFKGKAIISIALGWTYEKYREILPQETRVAFVMPNTPPAWWARGWPFWRKPTTSPPKNWIHQGPF